MKCVVLDCNEEAFLPLPEDDAAYLHALVRATGPLPDPPSIKVCEEHYDRMTER
jgi:hypothetical protein